MRPWCALARRRTACARSGRGRETVRDAARYLNVAGGALTIYAPLAGGVEAQYFYTPFSTMFSNAHVVAAAAGVFVAGLSSIAAGIDFIATCCGHVTGRDGGRRRIRDRCPS
jgi:hypothetical protein